jgi:hypothetical protein
MARRQVECDFTATLRSLGNSLFLPSAVRATGWRDGTFLTSVLATAAVVTALLILLSFMLGCRGACCEGLCEHCGETKGPKLR